MDIQVPCSLKLIILVSGKDLRLTSLFVGCHIIIKAIVLKFLCKETENMETTESVKKGTF